MKSKRRHRNNISAMSRYEFMIDMIEHKGLLFRKA